MKLSLKNIKVVLNDSKKISKKINKSSFYVIFDMIKSNLKYGASYKNYIDFEFYLLKDGERNTYLTDKYLNLITSKYNNLDDLNKLYDRIYFCNYFKEFIHRDFIDMREVNFKEFRNYISDKDKIVAKCIVGNSNEEIIEIDKNAIKNEYNVLKIYNSIMKHEQFLVMEYKSIEKSFIDICENGYIKVVTFLDDNMECHILKVILKSGNMHAFVNEDGIVYTPFINNNGKVYCKYPNSKKEVLNFKIPFYNDLKDLMTKSAKMVPNVRYLEWNVAITDKGLSLIDIEEFSNACEIKASISSNKKGSLEKYKKIMNI